MIRPFTFVCALLAAGSGLYLYQAKHDGQMQNREIQNLLEEADKYRQQVIVVATEYQLETNPDRLTDLANRFLTGLKPNQPAQFTTLADLDERLPAVRPPEPPPTSLPEQSAVFDYPRPPSAQSPTVVEPSTTPIAQTEPPRTLVASAKPATSEIVARPPQAAASSGAAKPTVVAAEQATTRVPPPPMPSSSSPSLIAAAAAATLAPATPKTAPRVGPAVVRDPGPAVYQAPVSQMAEIARAPQTPPPPRVVPTPRPVQYMARQPAPAAATSGAALPPGGPLFGGSGAAPAAPAPSSLGMARSMVYEQPRYPAYQTTGPIGNGS